METLSFVLFFALFSTSVLQVFTTSNNVDLNNVFGDMVTAANDEKSQGTENTFEKGNNIDVKRNQRSIYGTGPRMLQISRSKIPIELDLLVENSENDRLKRFDDYGHMRFGKRGGDEQFDDYGHMRFGRNT